MLIQHGFIEQDTSLLRRIQAVYVNYSIHLGVADVLDITDTAERSFLLFLCIYSPNDALSDIMRSTISNSTTISAVGVYMMMIVGVLTCLFAVFQLSQHNHWYSLFMIESMGVRTTEPDRLQL